MISKLLGIFYQNALSYREYKRDSNGRFAKNNTQKPVPVESQPKKLSHTEDVKAIASGIKDWDEHHRKMEEIIEDKELQNSLGSLDKFKADSEQASKRGHKELTLPPGIYLPKSQEKANKDYHDKNLKINIDKNQSTLGSFYRINGDKLGGIITENNGVHQVSLRHLYGTKGTTNFNSAEEADKYLQGVIRDFANKRIIPVHKKDETINSHLQKIQSLKDKNKNNFYKNTDKEILYDNIGIAEEIKSLLKSKSNAIATVDEEGNIQAAAKYKGKGNHIYVDFLATAPWNLAESHDKKVKGAGAKTLAKLAQKSIEKGYNGKLKLTPLDKAKTFYNHLGFVEDENGKMHLSPDAAKKLIEKYGDK